MSNKGLAKAFKSKPFVIGLVLLVVMLLVLLGYWLVSLLPDQPQAKKRVQQITVITPPPPPPPPPPQEKLEEPEIEEEVPPEEEPIDDSPPEESPDDAPPPGEDLGVDAEGSGAGDSFGLVGKKGGRGLLDGGGGGGYGVLIQTEINKALLKDPKLKRMAYEAIVTVWLNSDGSIDRHKVRMISGDAKKELERFLNDFGHFSKRLPLEEGNDWFKIKIRSQI